ncbi:MAG: 3'-5' exonuclease [Archaeoglobaceae archaeon]
MNIRDTKFASLDLETTGLDPYKDEIIAIGIIPIEGLKILSSNSFYSLVKPKRLKLKTLKIHGISERDLRNAPFFEEISQRVYEMLRDSIIVGFCVEVDYAFLKNALKDFKAQTIEIMKVDKVLSRFIGEKYVESPNLEALAKKYGLRTPYRHNALADAFLAAQIFQIQLLRLLKVGVNTLEKLLQILNEPEQPII